MARIHAMLILLLLAGLAVPPQVAGEEVQETAVHFGVPRRAVAPGLDFEMGCSVTAGHGTLALRDGGADETFLGLSPGPCKITIFVVGVGIDLPLLDSAPIGRLAYRIPGVAGITFGLADVSVDLVVHVDTTLLDEVPGLAVTPHNASWNRWGATKLAVSANLGSTGSTLRLALPFNVTMNLSLGVSVYTFGIPIFSVPLLSLGTLAGTPSLEVPVEVDRRPSAVIATASGASRSAIRVNWTPSPDDDFAYVRVVVTPTGGTAIVFVVEDRNVTTTEVPALPGTEYTIQVSIVDRGGQVSDISSVSARTLPPSESGSPSAPDASGVLGIVVVSVLVGLALGFLIRRRKGPAT